MRILHFFPGGGLFLNSEGKGQASTACLRCRNSVKSDSKLRYYVITKGYFTVLTTEHIIFTQILYTVSKRELHLEVFSVLHNDELTHCAQCIFIL